MVKELIISLAKTFLTRDRLKDILEELIDIAAQEIVDETSDEVGEMTIDEAIILLKNRLLVLIDEHLGDDDE